MHAFNVKAIEAADARKLPYTGGSDAHIPWEVGSCFTEFDEAVTGENLVEALKAGKYRGVDSRKISRLTIKNFLDLSRFLFIPSKRQKHFSHRRKGRQENLNVLVLITTNLAFF